MKSPLLPELVLHSREVTVPAGQCVFRQGQTADHYLIVTAGTVKVFARSAEGREVVLYRVREGEMCTLTTCCMLARSRYPAEAVTEEEVRARTIPADDFDQALNDSAEFRKFVFEGFSGRLADIMQRMERLVLESVHNRLARNLLNRADAEGVVSMTHEELALDIGSAREVVSRHLKLLEQQGLISTGRGQIRILRTEALEALA
jgi:CRP/FNR family transcriptional regulator